MHRDDYKESDEHRGRLENELDSTLDAALATYAKVEPRVGLEQRILANLRVQHSPGARLTRWWLGMTVAALAMLAIMLTLRSVTTRHRPVVQHTAPPGHVVPSSPMDDHKAFAANEQRHPSSVRRSNARVPKPMNGAIPKRDVFPSPEPLTEQEVILASYIAKDPEHAALVAEARTQALQSEQEIRRHLADDDRDSQQ